MLRLYPFTLSLTLLLLTYLDKITSTANQHNSMKKGGQRDSAEGKIRGLGEEEVCLYVENSQDVIRVA